MKTVVAIDPATTTGIALVGYNRSGPPVYMGSATVKLDSKKRSGWFSKASDAVSEVVNRDRHLNSSACVEPACWVIETWSHHRNFRDAIRLAQIQQVWIDVACSLGSQPFLYNVTSWQAAIGAGALKSKVHGANARKNHAQAWAKRTYRLDKKITNDVADALCMAGVWVGENRYNQEELTL